MTQPEKAHVKEFYDRHYYADISDAGKATSHHLRLAKQLGIKSEERLLDVACGTGEWLKAVVDRGAVAHGIDLSEKAIEFCRTDNPAGQFQCHSADELPFEDRYFDWVTCLGSLEHFPDKPASISEMARVLKPGGQLIISVPNSQFIGYRLGLYRGTNQAHVIETPLRISEWTDLGEKAGLELEKKWRDLHFLNRAWITTNGWLLAVPRGLAAILISVLPLGLQYQVYFCFRKP